MMRTIDGLMLVGDKKSIFGDWLRDCDRSGRGAENSSHIEKFLLKMF